MFFRLNFEKKSSHFTKDLTFHPLSSKCYNKKKTPCKLYKMLHKFTLIKSLSLSLSGNKNELLVSIYR